jgi:hypothetical protein
MELTLTVDNKSKFEKPNGDTVVDLTQQRLTPSQAFTILDIIRVSKDFEGRPDLIAQLCYGDMNTVDHVLKTNFISNPFSIAMNDVIYVQERRNIEVQFTNADSVSKREEIRNQYLDPSKAPKKDKNLQAFDNRQKPKKGKNDEVALPPNFAKFGEKEITLSGGKVIFGADVSSNKNQVEEVPLSKSEFLKRLLKNKK